MKSFSCFLLAFTIGSLVLCGCNSKGGVIPQDATESRSENLYISAAVNDGWQQASVRSSGDTFDRPGRLVRAFAKLSGPYSYIIKVEKDVPLDQFTLEDYLHANRTQYTSLPAYELVDEGVVDFHARKFHRFRFKVNGAKGPGAMHAHIFRDGTNMVAVQWTFPIGNDGELSVPAAITKFDEGVAIDILSQSNK